MKRTPTNHSHGYYKMNESSQLIRDGTYDSEQHVPELIAAVASGEYFLTLATLLDGLSDDHPELQQIVRDLLYLQKEYKIIARDK